MNEQEIKELKNEVKTAVHLFMAESPNLLDLKAHEQSISHRIAVYLEPLFKGLNVDCEYNKHSDLPKKIDLSGITPDKHQACGCKACRKIIEDQTLEIEEQHFRPDILVHRRGGDDGNLIAIEVKKTKECFFDQAKLKALTAKDGKYKYDLGIYVNFMDGGPRFKFFYNGDLIE